MHCRFTKSVLFAFLTLLFLSTASQRQEGLSKPLNISRRIKKMKHGTSLLPISWNPRTWFNDNLHVVEKGKCYRSKTLSPKSLENIIKKHQIKTILNLREEDSRAKWYQDEVRIAQKYSINLKTISLNPNKKPPKGELKEIINLFVNAPKPILLHCQAGADRTGLASALWKLEMNNSSLKEALGQLRMKRGHYSLFRPKMKETIRELHSLMTKNDNNIEKSLENYNV